MLLKKISLVGFFLFCLFIASSPAYACACCAEPGFYEITTAKPDKFYMDLLGEIKFAKASKLYMDAGEFEPIRGLDELKKDNENGKSIDFNIVETFLQGTWRLNVKTGAGRSGSFVLPMPATMTRYKADHHNSPTDVEPVLYKEFIVTGRVGSGNGIFRSAGARPTNYTLVLQGRGNMCDNASDFTHWRLGLNGPTAKYAFFGKLGS